MNLRKTLILPALTLLAAPAAAVTPAIRAQWLMGTVCEITAYGPSARRAESAAFAEIARWDRVLSLYIEESELSALNREAAGRPFSCSQRMWEAVSLALRYAQASGGAFDVTVLPVLKKGPGALDRVGFSKLALDAAKRTVFFRRNGMGLDFGGIGKGLALDHAARILREQGAESAMINFGGQILAFGAPPGKPGWSVEVPGQSRKFLLKEVSVSTSGNEERPGHVVSSFTGRPVLDARAVTVIAPTGAAADAWSTALFVLGRAPAAFDACALRPGSDPGPSCAPYLEHDDPHATASNGSGRGEIQSELQHRDNHDFKFELKTIGDASP